MSIDFGRVCALQGGGSEKPYSDLYLLCSSAIHMPGGDDLPKRLSEVWKKIDSLLPADVKRAPSWDTLADWDDKSLQDYNDQALGEKIILCQQRVFAATSGVSLPPPIAMEPFAEVIEHDKRLVASFEELVKGFEGEIEYPGYSKRVVSKIVQIRKLFAENPLLLSFFKNLDLQAHPELGKVVMEFEAPEPKATLDLKLSDLSDADLDKIRYKLPFCKSLVLTKCHYDLSKLLPLLPVVERLIMDDCDVITLPESLGGLTKLLTLHVWGSKFESFPLAICSLSQLKDLSLRGCDLSAVPEELSSLKALEKLDLSENAFTDIPEVISSLPRLDTLELDRNEIDQFPTIDDLPPSLQTLDLSNTNITSLPGGFMYVLEKISVIISGNKDAKGNYLSDDVDKICELVRQLESLKDTHGYDF